jgi:hypothetical protein
MRSAGAKAGIFPYSLTMAQIGIVKGTTAGPDGIYFSVPGVVVVTWDPTCKAVCGKWQSWATPTEFAGALEAGLSCLKEHGGSQWLADCTEMRAVKQSDQEWYDQNWFPRALAAGLRRMAVVNPKSGLSRMNMDDMMGRVPASRLEVAFFGAVAEAKDWLNRPVIKTPASREAQPA